MVDLGARISPTIRTVNVAAEVAVMDDTSRLKLVPTPRWRLAVVDRVAEGAERHLRLVSLGQFYDDLRGLVPMSFSCAFFLRFLRDCLYESFVSRKNGTFVAIDATVPELLAAEALVEATDWAGDLPRRSVSPEDHPVATGPRAPHLILVCFHVFVLLELLVLFQSFGLSSVCQQRPKRSFSYSLFAAALQAADLVDLCQTGLRAHILDHTGHAEAVLAVLGRLKRLSRVTYAT